MVSQLEQSIRELDDESKTVAEATEEITRQLDANNKTVREYLKAKRKGFGSFRMYLDYNAREQGFSSHNDKTVKKAGCKTPIEYFNKRVKERGFNSWRDYLEQRARKRGFPSLSTYDRLIRKRTAQRAGFRSYSEQRDAEARERGFKNYNDYLAKKRGFNSVTEMLNAKAQKKGFNSYQEYLDIRKQKKFEQEIEIVSPKKLDELTNEEDIINRELVTQIIPQMLMALPERESYIIRERYFADRTLEELGKELKVSGERIRQIESRALRRLFYQSKQKGLDYEVEKKAA